MRDSDSGIAWLRSGEALEQVALKGLELRLLASGDGTELIYHKLAQGSHWGLSPAAGWTALEGLFIVSGSLRWAHGGEKRVLTAGDFLSATPVLKEAVFVAETDVEFLYCSSQPVFHHYSNQIRGLMGLAVDIEQKDGYTSDHCHRIMKLSMMLGETMGLSSTDLAYLNFGAFLHDVGKIKVPDSILGKPGKLTDEEWSVMRRHPTFGREILQETGLPSLLSAGPIVEQHHERFDGSGYPHGLSGADISIPSAIVAVVDSYDALTTNRVYRPGIPKAEALDEIDRSRRQYHPDVVEALFLNADRLDG
ncbi:HD-GYP domain-containing protein [Paenibacillus sp.]|uniref:HD-GYP domain-containing protein n=1 Tax=Paenibacillus sp. TaxID=58172 RepID=UPI002D47D371|nr:HD-GYP domain-containing protein [Paenibacillus sp.]HZG57388.1 HD-GYP domain-containing protein [Paenibacillus sp.]